VLFEGMLGAKGQVMEFERLARAIQQVIVLQFEIRGPFEVPNRDARRLRLTKSDREGLEPPDREDLLADLREFREFEREMDGPRPDYRTRPARQGGCRRRSQSWPPCEPSRRPAVTASASR
jgi:hypothetical protein